MSACVAVVGGRGQLARALSEVAESSGTRIVTLARPQFDLRDASSVDRNFERLCAEVVVNAAAHTAVDQAESEEAAAYAVNALGAEHLAKACARRSIPLIHVSTDYVFDGASFVPYAETDAACPLSVYGKSKYEGEQRVALACPQHIILRTAWLYSPVGENFVKSMLRLADRRAKISVVADQYGNPTYAPHLAQAILVLASRIARQPSWSKWGLYHAVGTGEASRYELALEILRLSGLYGGPIAPVVAIASAEFPTLAPRPLNSRISGDKLARDFGIRLPHWTTGVEECVKRILEARNAT